MADIFHPRLLGKTSLFGTKAVIGGNHVGRVRGPTSRLTPYNERERVSETQVENEKLPHWLIRPPHSIKNNSNPVIHRRLIATKIKTRKKKNRTIVSIFLNKCLV